MYLWIGLGNPGEAYAAHRHNVGFMWIEAMRAAVGAEGESEKFFSRFSQGRADGEKVLFLRPQTYMNRSGIAAAAAATFYKIPPERVLAVHDDLDLPVGTVRIKTGGGHAGHNGLKSLDAHIGPGYRRLRIGIGHPGDRDRVESWVLGRFTGEERTRIDRVIAASADLRVDLLRGEPDVAARISREAD